jgi:hypothetical protein
VTQAEVSYAKMLGTLEKDAFQDEVCARLASVFADFQRIPAKPRGDAGLDGLSHGQARAYCCYGPEQEAFKTNVKGLKADIVAKFRGDLRRIFELDYEKKKLVRKSTPEMKTILAAGRRIANVYLIVSCFESHQIIGPLNESFQEYTAASSCTYIDAHAQPTIWGPKDLATLWPVDEHAMFRIENRALLVHMKHAVEAGIVPKTIGDFHGKFEYVRAKDPTSVERLDRLEERFRAAWSTALALDNSLAATSMSLHEALEQARTQSTITADLRSAQQGDPMKLLLEMRDAVKGHLSEAFGERLGPHMGELADGEIARLIGECPIEWRRAK